MSKRRKGPKMTDAGKVDAPTTEAVEEVEEEITDEGEAIAPEPEVEAEDPVEEEITLQAGSMVDMSPKVKADKGAKMFRIVIDEQDNNDKNGPVRCTDGRGRQYMIPRGVECNVPEGVVNVIRESVFTTYEKDAQGNDIERNIPRFAMRVIKEL